MLSCVALRLACICGSATLAMVVSSTCSSTAIITPMVTISRWPVGNGWTARWLGVSSAIGGLAPLLLAGVVEIDPGVHRKARDHRLVGRAVERNPDRHPLCNLDPVAVGILRRKQRELAAGARADALDVALELLSAIGINL